MSNKEYICRTPQCNEDFNALNWFKNDTRCKPGIKYIIEYSDVWKAYFIYLPTSNTMQDIKGSFMLYVDVLNYIWENKTALEVDKTDCVLIDNYNYVPIQTIKDRVEDEEWRLIQSKVVTVTFGLEPNAYTVQFQEWNNNHSHMQHPENCTDLGYAKWRADNFYSLEVSQDTTPGFENCYYNNGIKTWVEDSNGNIVYAPTAI
jgi:hypothetical protein